MATDRRNGSDEKRKQNLLVDSKQLPHTPLSSFRSFIHIRIQQTLSRQSVINPSNTNTIILLKHDATKPYNFYTGLYYNFYIVLTITNHMGSHILNMTPLYLPYFESCVFADRNM
jgi:hypothetical protein